MKSVFQLLFIFIIANSVDISAQKVTPGEIKKEHKKTIVIQKLDKDGNITEERFETENGEFSPEVKQKMKELKMEMKDSKEGENITIEISGERNSEPDKDTERRWSRHGKYGRKWFGKSPEFRKQIMKKKMLHEHSPVENKAVLGVEIDDTRNGVRITEIIPGSAAGSSSLRRGDVILKINDSYIFSADGLLEALNPFNPGDKVKVRYLREGKEKSTQVVLKAKS